MRARHRHFNPKDAGAVAAYDARFITGLSDGDNVSTWSSRTGTNDATQSTAGKQPNYETNEINGNPVVNFTPANSDELEISISVPSSLISVKVFRRNTAGIHSVGLGELSSAPRYDSWWFTDNVTYTAPRNAFNTHGAADTRTGLFIDSWQKSGTTSSQVWRNGVSVGPSQTPQASSGSFTRLGRTANANQPYGFHNGAMGCLCLLDRADSPIRKRLEHAAAYSFKIACS